MTQKLLFDYTKKALNWLTITGWPRLKETTQKKWFLPSLSAALISFGVISLVLTYAPIVKVELEYQFKWTLHEVFHVQDLRALIFPQFKLNLVNTKYPQFGMQIPSLYLDEPIISNIDPTNKDMYTVALKKGIAHAAGTDLPPYQGLGYYFAHSSNPDLRSQYNAVFYLLGKLEKDDEVYIWFDNEKYEYKVVDKKITEPSDVSFTQQTYEKPTVVLQTCWPPGTTSKRMLIFAERK